MSFPLTIALVWLTVAALVPFVPWHRQRGELIYGVALIGVPLMGLVTFLAGPFLGLAMMALGALALLGPLAADFEAEDDSGL